MTLIKSDAVSKYLKQTKDLYGDQLFLSLANGFNHVDSSDESLDQFFDRINQCQKCQLGQTRTNFVFGVGDPDADIVLGSREARSAVRIGEPSRRHFMGRVFNWLVTLLAVPGLADTQCGFKCFHSEAARELFPWITVDGFAFDVELFHLARILGFTYSEVGVDWYYRPQSKVRPLQDSLRMTADLLKIRWRHRNHR